MYFKLFAKCRWKFPVAFLYQSVNIDDIMLFPAKRRWNFPLIFYICLQHVDGNFERHFFNLFKDTDDICFCIQNVTKTFHCKNADGTFYCKMSMEISIDIFLSIEEMSMEISIDILLLSLNQIRICKVFSQIFSGNKFTKNEQFLLKRFTLGKNIVF